MTNKSTGIIFAFKWARKRRRIKFMSILSYSANKTSNDERMGSIYRFTTYATINMTVNKDSILVAVA